MSRIEERVDRAFVVEVAGMTVDAHKPRRCRICTDEGCEHEPRRRCQSCTDDGCEQLAWAQRSLAEHRAALAQTIPQQRPAAPDCRRSKEHGMEIGVWFKSSKSGPNCDNCVEVFANVDGTVLTRDSKDPNGPVHTWKPGEWDAFIEGAKAGEFDRA